MRFPGNLSGLPWTAFARQWGWRGLSAALALLVGLLMQWCERSLPGQGLNRLIHDPVLRWHASTLPDPRMVVVDIDEASLAQVGAWPWRRAQLADLVELLLSDYQARAVALDFVLPQGGDAAGDRRLRALGEHAPVVFAQAFDYTPRSPPLRMGALAGGWRAPATGHGTTQAVPASGYIGNQAALALARCVGNIGLVPDEDGAIRRLPVLTQFDGALYEPLALALVRCAGHYPSLAAGTAYLPAVPSVAGFWTLPYRRSWAAYTVVSAVDILKARVPPALLADKLVLVGSSSFGLGDRVVTPLDHSTAGVLVHASALTELLDQAGRVDAGRAAVTDLRWLASLWVLATVLAGVLMFRRMSALWSTALLGLSSLGWLLLVFLVLPADARFAAASPLVSNLVLLLLAIPYEWRLTQLHSQRLIQTFRHYVAKPVLDKLLLQPGLDPLAPRFLRVTTLIADMQGYAGLVENAPLHDAVALTRDFLDCITRPVLDHDGTLDKYTGDGLMSFWGAPLPTSDHADKAMDAALAMVAAVKAFNQKRLSQGKPALRVRIGIDTGLAVAGDLGTPFRGAYTAVGDSVNVASRLQELARDLPHDVVVGPGTAADVHRHSVRRLGEIRLRGRKKPLQIYTPEALI